MLISAPGTKPDHLLITQIINSVNLVDSYEESTLLVEELLKDKTPVILSFINAHAINLCYTNRDFGAALIKSDIILRDGVGMEILFKTININPAMNMNGTDYIPKLLDCFKGKKIALLGTEELYLKNAAKKLSLQGHSIMLSETGFHALEHYVHLVKKTKPDVIILGMGMPKQEKLALLLKENIPHNCLIINGGAIIDYWGNKVRRAPMWLRRMKLEWAFRLAQEPDRLFSRYVIGNYVFLKRTRKLKKQFVSQSFNLANSDASELRNMTTTIQSKRTFNIVQ